jgi:hypothetical protein
MAFDSSSEINLLPPPELSLPLWRSLARNLREYFHSSRQPPLVITSKPAQVGMLVGDILDIPWYRTVFTNIGDVISPETLPPLELESHAVDVGELVSDQIQRGWWASLLRNLADTVAPEKLPPLELSSSPIDPKTSSQFLMVPSWSALVDSPRVAAAGQSTVSTLSGARFVHPGTPAKTAAPDAVSVSRAEMEEVARAQHALRRARLREACWISAAAIQITFLLAWHVVGK